MPVQITSVSNQQELEVEVSGPTPANRLLILTGVAQLGNFGPTPGGEIKETFTLLVGPPLTRTQFVRAIASAAPADVATGGQSARWAIPLVDADFDDDTGRTELRIEAELRGDDLVMPAISFQAMILAAL